MSKRCCRSVDAYQEATDWHSRIPPLTERALPDNAAPAGEALPSQDFARERAAALGLTYVRDDDWAGISASIVPMLEQLESARSMLSQNDAPSVRGAGDWASQPTLTLQLDIC